MTVLEEVTAFLKETIEGYKYVVEVKKPLEQFEDTIPYKISDIYSWPSDYAEFKKYANDKYGSFEGYFSFLVKS